ncbi:FAD-binding oxidoreductase [Actinomycetospora sp. NBRC 106375]|uniref:FAD-binding oxidoreductase n=1 Tax=Actinomycetospora sp. NBRC 106375 TaxID=3032207 RepID=UPI00255672EC|nr:FAD-binding oxidoreductase [Actinomycetospora sp. NBRC 106375]
MTAETPTTTPAGALPSALDEWRNLLGDDSVVTQDEPLDAAARATFATSSRPSAILLPSTVDDVAACLRVATRWAVPIYPVSRGKNWGYGSRAAHRDCSVILDMSRLNKVRDFDEELGHITVEPGVTQDDVLDFLERRGSHRMLSHPGSLGSISLLGNLLERGFGVFTGGPYEDRARYSTNFEVVTATGTQFSTGIGKYGPSSIAALDDWGVGPQLNGLFLQSNLGVVTAATLWLAHRPRFPQHIAVNLDEGDLPQLIDALRTVRQANPNHRFYLINRVGLAARTRPYPRRTQDRGRALLDDEELTELTGLAREWTCIGLLHAETRRQRRAELDLVKSALGRLRRQGHYPNTDRARILRRLWWPLKMLTGTDVRQALDAFYDHSTVRPFDTSTAVNQLFWRKRTSAPTNPDPDRDGCGLIWFLPMIPWRARDITSVVGTCRNVMTNAGFEPTIALRFPADRTVLVACSIQFDRDEPGADDRAMDCYEALFAAVADLGYLPYRAGLQGMAMYPSPEPGWQDVFARLKSALDPNGVIAPGRYDHTIN